MEWEVWAGVFLTCCVSIVYRIVFFTPSERLLIVFFLKYAEVVLGAVVRRFV